MNKLRSTLDEWTLFVLAFGVFGVLFIARPATWMSTLIIILGGLIVTFNVEHRDRFITLFKHQQLKLIVWPFLMWMCVALLIAIVHSEWTKILVPSNELRFVLALSILCFSVHKKTKHAFYAGLIAGSFFAVTWGIYEKLVVGFWRAQATTNNPIYFGNLTALIALLSFSAALLDVAIGIKYRSALLLSAILAVVASMTSLTRSSVILVLCVVPLIWLPQKDDLRKFAVKLLGFSVVVLICAIGFSAQVRDRLRLNEFTAAFNIPEKIDYERLTSNRANMWHAAVLVFKAHPIVGVGPKGFSEAFESLAHDGIVQKTKLHNQPHNDILYVASTGGGLKLSAYLALILGPFVFFYKAYQSKSDLDSKVPSILGMQVVATFFLTGLTNSNFDLQIYSTTYAVLVCLLAKLCLQDESES